MIGVLKSKGVPVLWVGLPVVYGPKATADTLFLDSLYRDVAAATSAWRMSMSGTALSTRPAASCRRARTSKVRGAGQLRSYDGVYFTKAARASWPIMSSAKSRACSPRVRRRSHCQPSLRTPMPMPCPVSPRRSLADQILPLVASSVRHRSIARGAGNATGRGRCARRAYAVQGERTPPPAAPTIFVAAPRSRTRRGQG